jgi:MoaA/NifB/PqqE/SkfB family radical SAM enzyme
MGPNDDPGPILRIDELVNSITWLCERFDADLHLEGGEMFLRSDVDEILAALPPQCLSALTLTTSGTVPIRVRPELLKKVGDLRISVEGHTDSLQRIMRPANLSRVKKSLAELRENEVPFTLRITLFRSNAPYVREMLEAFSEWGATRISFFEFQSSGRGNEHADEYSLSDSEFDIALTAFTERQPPVGIKLLKISLSSRRDALAEQKRHIWEPIGFKKISFSGIPNLTINSNGDLGISPWEATAHKLNDCFANLRQVDLRSEVEMRWRSGQLHQNCAHTSSLQLRYACSP